MTDCTPGDKKTEDDIDYVCVGGQWVPLPPVLNHGPGPVATVIVDNRDQLAATLQRKEISEALDSPHTRLAISIVPQPHDGE